jgi:chemotaxis protein methyltransferase CheR
VKAVVSAHDTERFRALVAKRLGLWFDDGKLEYLSGVLERRLNANGEGATPYLAKLESPPGSQAELKEVAQELTVGETYFFRHTDQFRAFAEVALPARIEARSVCRQLRILSAGCSSGEEGYSLSILTRQHLSGASWDVAINGIDINPKAVERARRARYSSWALRETPDDVQKRYFVADGREYVLADAIRDSVRFEEQNLIGDHAWAPECYDIVFCRNVLMYFTPESAQRVVARLARAMAPGGYLFLGHAENLRGLSQDFELCHTHGTFYYRRKAEFGAPSVPVQLQNAPASTSRAPTPIDWTSTWLETVQRSSDRIRVLNEKVPAKATATRAAPPAARPDLTLALELLAHERFAEALDVVSGLPLGSAQDTDALLLRAALLTHCGKLEAADQACTDLLALDGLSAGAHYLRALCRERNGEAREAVEHAQIASYLDSSFAMPHLHLGLMARRTGDRSAAQRELSQAALLLQREDASRLLLFGGGFTRDGLIAMCHSELQRLGDPA